MQSQMCRQEDELQTAGVMPCADEVSNGVMVPQAKKTRDARRIPGGEEEA